MSSGKKMMRCEVMRVDLLTLVFLVWLRSRQTEGSCFGINHNCSQICIPLTHSFLCQCFHGYRLARDGRTCLDIDECKEYRPCHHICTNTEGSFECACHEGYDVDVSSDYCIDKNECLDPGSCIIDGIKRVCVNIPGGYQCLTDIVVQDGHVLLDTELVGIPESEDEHENSTAIEILAITKAPTTAATPSSTTIDGPSPGPNCPKVGTDSNGGYSIGSAFSSYQLNIIAGCFITAIGLIVVFVIVFVVIQMRRKQRLRSRGLMASPRTNSPASTTSLNASSPPHQWRRNYARYPERRSARRWKPYTHSEVPSGRQAPVARSRAANDGVSKMAESEKNRNILKEDENNNAAVIPAFV